MRILKTLSIYPLLSLLLAIGSSKAAVSRSTLNCKYQLIPEFVDCLGYGNHELYYSETRGIRHEPENRILLNVRYRSVISVSLERSFDSDLDFSYLQIVQATNEDLVAEGNLTWGVAGNNTRLFLRATLDPSQYLLVIGSSFVKNEDGLEKIDGSYCSPINFELGITTPDIINSLSSLLLNDPFKKPLINLSSDEKYEYSNQIGDPFVVRTTPQGVNYSSKLYKATILWSKLFTIPQSGSKDEKLLNLHVELGFKFSRMPLQLVIEPLGLHQVHRELESHQIGQTIHSRVFFGTPVYNGQLFKGSVSQKSFRLVIVAPWMESVPRFVQFDLKISISFHTHSEKLSDEFLSSQNVCNLPKLPTNIVQDGLTSERVQDLRTPNSVSVDHLLFGPKFNLQGPFESLTSHTNHVIHIKISRPSIFYLLSYHDHSDIAVALSRSPDVSEEDEDIEFFDDILEFDEAEDHQVARKSTLCTSQNLNHAGVTSREMNLIYCKISRPDDYYLHIHSYKISETQNSISLCTPFHLFIEVFPVSQKASGCENPVSLRRYELQVSPDANAALKKNSITPDSSSMFAGSAASRISKIYTRDFRVKDLTPTYLSIQLRIPEHPQSLVFINVLYKNRIWLTLTPHTLHSFFASVGPLVSGIYQLQLFTTFPENSDVHETICIQFYEKISLVQLPVEPPTKDLDIFTGDKQSPFVRCQMSQMMLPKEIDLTQYSEGEEYVLDGTFLAPLEEHGAQEFYESVTSDTFVSYITTLHLSLPSVLKVSITNYPGFILIHSKHKTPTKIGPNDSNSFFAELGKGTHDLIFEFDIIDEAVDEKLEEGGCPTFRLHLSVVSTEDLPIFPPLILPRLYEYVTGDSRKSKSLSEWSHTELLSVSRDYLSKLFPAGSLAFHVSRSIISPISQDLTANDILIRRGDCFEIREMMFWFSPFMQISIPLESELEEVGLSLVLEIHPAWTPITVRLLRDTETDSERKARHNSVRYSSVLQTGNKIECSFPSIKDGKYKLVISSKGQFSKLTMGRSALLKMSGSIKPTPKNRLFSLRQELISIPDILPFQELPDSLNRIRFLSESSRGFVGTLMFNLKGTKLTRLKVPENETHLLRILSEPTLISGYEFFVVIFKTKEGDKELKNHVVFMSGKYGDTLVLLSPGEYEIRFSPAPNNMPYLITFGLIKFNPAEYEAFFRKNLSLSKSVTLERFGGGGVGVVSPGRIRGTKDSVENNVSDKSRGETEAWSRHKCHYYLEGLNIHINEENSPYFNSGVINVCQGEVMSERKSSTFSSSINDIKLNVASSSVVYLQTRSDFLYSFYRIGIIVPEGFWVAEQRGSQSYLEVELTKGQYILRIESLNSFRSYEEHEMLLFSMFVEISPIDGSETALDASKVVDHSLDVDTSKNKGLSHSNVNSKCHIPNGVPLPLDLTSIQGGSTVFGGPLDTNKPMFLFRSRITLTDIHNGRKKIFMELNKKLFPTFIRLYLSPVNFDISESPNMLEVLFTKINSTPISHIYTNVDSLLNSVEKVFKLDASVIGNEHLGSLNIPFWMTFTHKLDSINNRIPCLAFDLIIHTVSPQNKYLKFLSPPLHTTLADPWFSSVQTKLNKALSVASFPQYVYLPPSSIVISMNSDELETDLMLDLKRISPGQALLIADLYYNPLLVSSKLNLYSESDSEHSEEEENDNSSPEVTLIKSSSLNFNGNVSTPLYAMERITAVLTAQKHLLECSIKSIPPFKLRHVPVMLGISIVPINHQASRKHPLIVSITPSPSVPIIAGQNPHFTIRLSAPLKDRKGASGQITKSIYITARSESGPGERVHPYDVQVFDAGHTLSVSYSYLELAKVFLESQNKFSKHGFLVIDTINLPPDGSVSLYKPAPWISVYLETNNRLFIEMSGYKANAVGWGNVVWDGDQSVLKLSQESNLRSQHFVEKDSLQEVKQFSSQSDRRPIPEVSRPQDSVRVDSKVIHQQVDSSRPVQEGATDDRVGDFQQEAASSKQSRGKVLIFLVILVCLAAIYYHSFIYTLLRNLVSHVASRLGSSYRNKKEYNIIGERNDFDFLNNSISDEEDQDGGEDGLGTLNLHNASPNRHSSPHAVKKAGLQAPHSSPARPRKSK